MAQYVRGQEAKNGAIARGKQKKAMPKHQNQSEVVKQVRWNSPLHQGVRQDTRKTGTYKDTAVGRTRKRNTGRKLNSKKNVNQHNNTIKQRPTKGGDQSDALGPWYTVGNRRVTHKTKTKKRKGQSKNCINPGDNTKKKNHGTVARQIAHSPKQEYIERSHRAGVWQQSGLMR